MWWFPIIFRRVSRRTVSAREVPCQPAQPRPQPVNRHPTAGAVIAGRCYVIDGDTIMIKKTRIRLAGIDAPELDHPWGQKSKWALVAMCKNQTITAKVTGELSYDRVVARCYLPDGRDIAAELVRVGLARDWPKSSPAGGIAISNQPTRDVNSGVRLSVNLRDSPRRQLIVTLPPPSRLNRFEHASQPTREPDQAASTCSSNACAAACSAWRLDPASARAAWPSIRRASMTKSGA